MALCSVMAACADTHEDPAPIAVDCGAWRTGPKLLDFREASPALLLDDGRVLVVGGHFKGRGEPLDTSEIVDAAAGTSTFTGAFATTRTVVGVSGTVRMMDGRVLTASPWFDKKDPPVASEVWSPTTGAWTVTGAMAAPGGPAVALPDGRVLVAGGIDWTIDAPYARTEIWDPKTGTWSPSGAMTTPRTGHVLMVLPDGRPFAIGGFAKYPDGAGVGTSEIYEGGAWGRVAPMTDRRAGSAVLLADGRVLAAGGSNESGGYKQELSTAEIYDPATNAWTAVGSMKEPRARFAMAVLADGRVLATGGGYDYVVRSSAELFDPVTRTWSETKPMAIARGGLTMVRLQNGEVLVVGGAPGSYTTEVYTPCVRK